MKRAVVIGSPINHSKSPLIHSYWLKHYGVEGEYLAQEVRENELEEFVNKLRIRQIIGANVTLPLKTAILSHCDQLTATATQIGAVNTLYMQDNFLIGDNTDAQGFLANLDQGAQGWDHELEQVIVLGAGGACRALVSALISRQVKKIIILNRTLENAEKLTSWFAKYAHSINLIPDLLENYKKYAMATNMLINSTSIGLNNSRFEQIDLALLPDQAIVHDIVYVPLNTPLLKEAHFRGLKTVDGLGMLLHQAAPGFAQWFGVFPKVSPELRSIIEKSL